MQRLAQWAAAGGPAARAVLAAAAILGLSSSAARAHPHVWIDAGATFVFEGDRLARLRIDWVFDELFSTVMINQFDRNRDRRFDGEETDTLRAGAFANLKSFGYFTHLTVNQSKVDLAEVADFAAEVKDGRLVYRFTVRLLAPVDPAAAPVALRMFDETYYVDVTLGGDTSVRFEGITAGACRAVVTEEGADLAYFGLTPTKRIALQCP